MVNLLHGDCLELMKDIPDKSIDMILCDLPYGTSACRWDVVLPFEPLWEQYERIVKDGCAIVLFGSEPFSSHLRMSNLNDYKYDWVWDKKLAGNGINAKKQPLKVHENIMVFHSSRYYPIMEKGKLRNKMGLFESELTHSNTYCKQYKSDEYYPKSILPFSSAGLRSGRLHPTQKPVSLLEYLIKTYTNEGETVLDNCMGSGSTGVACVNTGRNFIGIELDPNYFEVAKHRIEDKEAQMGVEVDAWEG